MRIGLSVRRDRSCSRSAVLQDTIAAWLGWLPSITIRSDRACRLCEEIDERVTAFLERSIEGEWPYLWIDATCLKVRQNGRIVRDVTGWPSVILALSASSPQWPNGLGESSTSSSCSPS